MIFRETALVRRLAPWLHSGQTVLDVGSGNGVLAARVAASTGVCTTICDVIDCNKTSLPFIKLTDPMRLPVADRSFEAVTLCFVLHHIASGAGQSAMVEEALRVASNRVLVLEDTPIGCFEWGMNIAWDWILNAPSGVPTPFTFRSAAAWSRELSRNGFRVVATETFRGMWPTLGTYHHSLLVAQRD